MKRWLTLGLAIAVATTLIAAVGAVTGTHFTTGNRGYVGSDVAGLYGTGGVGVSGEGTSRGVTGSGPTGVRGDGETYGVYGSGSLYGVYGISSTFGVYGSGPTGVIGAGADTGVYGGGSDIGVYGNGENLGVYGEGFRGVRGVGSNAGVEGEGYFGVAARGTDSGGWGLYAWGAGGAGYFNGDAVVAGTLYKSAGSFRIDHPLDPANKYLSHSFVESPDMKNVYDGVVQLDAHGEAVVDLPEWFGTLNKDFRYQLTCIGEHAPIYIAAEITENRFRIAGGYAEMKVSWQVTGIRQDPYAVAHPIVVEEVKSPRERGRYLHPDLYGQPAAMSAAPSSAAARR